MKSNVFSVLMIFSLMIMLTQSVYSVSFNEEVSGSLNIILSQDSLTPEELESMILNNEKAMDLYDYAKEQGYSYLSSITKIEYSDGSIITNAYMKSSQERAILFTLKEKDGNMESMLVRMDGGNIEIFDRDGGVVMNEDGVSGYSNHQSCSTSLCTGKCVAYYGWGKGELASFMKDVADNLAGPCAGCSQNAKLCVAACGAGASACTTLVGCLPGMSVCVGCVGVTCGECMIAAGLNVWDGLAKVNDCRKECSDNPSKYPDYPGWHCDPKNSEKEKGCKGDIYFSSSCQDCDWNIDYELDCSTFKGVDGQPQTCGFSYKNGKVDYMCVDECKSEAECDDKNDCTIDTCTLGNCNHIMKKCPQPADRCSISYCVNKKGCVTKPNPGCDHPDDIFSVYITEDPVIAAIYENNKDINRKTDVAVLFEGFPESTEKLLNSINQNFTFVELGFKFEDIQNYKLLIVPSGGLSGLSGSKSFKEEITKYLENGGNIFVFSQKYGYEFDALPGDIEGYGWLEDQSCQYASVFLDTYHPMVSNIKSQKPSVNVDGYFTSIPENAQVVLRRVKNSMPVLITYNISRGNVIAYTAYSDWVFGHGTSAEEIDFVKNIIRWATDSDSDIIDTGRGEDITYKMNITTLPSMPFSDNRFKPGDKVIVDVNISNMDILVNGSVVYDSEDANRLVYDLYLPDASRKIIDINMDIDKDSVVGTQFEYQTNEDSVLGQYYFTYNLYSGNDLLTSGYAGGFTLTNYSEKYPTYKLQLKLSDPDNNIIKKVEEFNLSKGEIREYEFIKNNANKEGIWKLDYVLYGGTDEDKDGIVNYDTILFPVSLYSQNPFGFSYSASGISYSVTSEKEKYFYGENARFRIQIWNNYDEDKNVTVYWSFPHNYWATNDFVYGKPGTTSPGYRSNLVETVEVPAKGETSIYDDIIVHSYDRLWAEFYEGNNEPLKYLGKASRGIVAVPPGLDLQIVLDQEQFLKNEKIPLSINITNKELLEFNGSIEVTVSDNDNEKVYSDVINYYLDNNTIISLELPETNASGDFLITSQYFDSQNKDGNVVGSTHDIFNVPKDYLMKFYLDKDAKLSVLDNLSAFVEIINVGQDKLTTTLDISIPAVGYKKTFGVDLDAGEKTQIKALDDFKLENFSSGNHKIFAILNLDDYTMEKYFTIPVSKLSVYALDHSYNATDNVTLIIKNSGGVPTEYNINFGNHYYFPALLSEKNGTILPGEEKEIVVKISPYIYTGTHNVYLTYKDMETDVVGYFYDSFYIEEIKLFFEPKDNEYVAGENLTMIIENPSNIEMECHLQTYYTYLGIVPGKTVNIPSKSILEVDLGTIKKSISTDEYNIYGNCFEPNLYNWFNYNLKFNVTGTELLFSEDKSYYDADDEIVLTIQNTGPLDAECQSISASLGWRIIGSKSNEQIKSGEAEDFNFQIPGDIESGNYQLRINCFDKNSGRSFYYSNNIDIKGYEVVPSIDKKSYLAGENISVALFNNGGIATDLSCQSLINGVNIGTKTVSVEKGDTGSLDFRIPRSFDTSNSTLLVRCSDSHLLKYFSLNENISIKGFEIELTSKADEIDAGEKLEFKAVNSGIFSDLNCSYYLNHLLLGGEIISLGEGEENRSFVVVPYNIDTGNYTFKVICEDKDAMKESTLYKNINITGLELDLELGKDTVKTGNSVTVTIINNGGIDADCFINTSMGNVFGSQQYDDIFISKGSFAEYDYYTPTGLSEGDYKIIFECNESISGKLVRIIKNISIIGFDIDLTLEKYKYNSGDKVILNISNIGEINSTCEYIKLFRKGIFVDQKTFSEEVNVGESYEEYFDLSEDILSGIFTLVLGCEDEQVSVIRETSKVINITGPEITLVPDSAVFDVGESIGLETFNSGGTLIDGDVRVYLSSNSGEITLGTYNFGIGKGDSHVVSETLPLSVKTGTYSLVYEIEDTVSGLTLSDEEEVYVRGMGLEIFGITTGFERKIFVNLNNTGVINDDLDCTLNLFDRENNNPFSQNKDLLIPVGDNDKLEYIYPSSIIEGRYTARVLCEEQNSGDSVSETFYILLNGSSAQFEMDLSSDVFLTKQNIRNSFIANITGTDTFFNSKVLSRIFRISQDNSGEAWTFLNVTHECNISEMPWTSAISERQVWFPTSYGLCRYDIGTSSYQQIEFGDDDYESSFIFDIISGNEKVYIIAETETGYSFTSVLYVYDKASGTLDKYDDSDGFPEGFVNNPQLDKDDNLWFYSENMHAFSAAEIGVSEGSMMNVYVFRKDTSSFEQLDFEDLGLGDEEIRNFLVEGDNLWFFTSNKMIKVESDDSITNFKLPFNLWIYSLSYDEDYIWMNGANYSTSFNGVVRYDKNTLQFSNYTFSQSTQINTILSKGQHLWMSGSDYITNFIGIIKLNATTGNLSYLDNESSNMSSKYVSSIKKSFDSYEDMILVYQNGADLIIGGESTTSTKIIEYETNVDIHDGKNYAGEFSVGLPGLYQKIDLIRSSKNQYIGKAEAIFSVDWKNISYNYSFDKEIYKPGEKINLTIEISNYAQIKDDYVPIILSKDGNVIMDDIIEIGPNNRIVFDYLFFVNKSFMFTINISDKVSSRAITVKNASVNAEIIAPEYVSNSKFPFVINIENNGSVDAELFIDIFAHGNKIIDGFNVTVLKNESKNISNRLSILHNTTFNVSISGDAEIYLSKRIENSEIVNLEILKKNFLKSGENDIPVNFTNIGKADSWKNATFELGAKIYAFELYIPSNTSLAQKLKFNLSNGINTLQYHSGYEKKNYSIGAGTPIFTYNISKNLSFYIGENVSIIIGLSNIGGINGETAAGVEIPGIFEDNLFYYLKSGETRQVIFNVSIPNDLVEGEYNIFYNLNGSMIEDVFNLKGADITVKASLDKKAYMENDTAKLNITIINNNDLDLKLNSKVQYELDNQMNETFFLYGNGNSTLEYNIDVDNLYEGKINYFIYHESGRSLYINSININKVISDDIIILTDKPYYNEGDKINITIIPKQKGNLTLNFLNNKFESEINLDTNLSYDIPELISSTYYIEYSFNTGAVNTTGSIPVDIFGVNARLLQFMTDKDVYMENSEIHLDLDIESNKDLSGEVIISIEDTNGKQRSLETFGYDLNEGKNKLSFVKQIDSGVFGINKVTVDFRSDLGGQDNARIIYASKYFDVVSSNNQTFIDLINSLYDFDGYEISFNFTKKGDGKYILIVTGYTEDGKYFKKLYEFAFASGEIIGPNLISEQQDFYNGSQGNLLNFTEFGLSLNVSMEEDYFGNITVEQAENGSGNFGVIGTGQYFTIEAPEISTEMKKAMIKVLYNESEIISKGIDPETLRLWYYNETNDTWIIYDAPDGGVNTVKKYVWAITDHFSKWSIFGSEKKTVKKKKTTVPSGSSSGGSSGGGSVIITENNDTNCTSVWECSDWTECDPATNLQTRSCTDLNSCEDADVPLSERECATVQEEDDELDETIPDSTNEKTSGSDNESAEGSDIIEDESKGLTSITGNIVNAFNLPKSSLVPVILIFLVLVIIGGAIYIKNNGIPVGKDKYAKAAYYHEKGFEAYMRGNQKKAAKYYEKSRKFREE